MEKVILWDSRITGGFLQATELQLDAFLDLVIYIQSGSIDNFVPQIIWDDQKLWEWLYSKDQFELNDIKRELSKRISKAKTIDSEEFDRYYDKIGKTEKVKTLVLFFDNECVYYISSISEYYAGIRSYLNMEKKDEFCKDLPECFPNIFFSEGIATTINTLNRRFEDIREEIIIHLTQIDNYQRKFMVLLNQNKSYKEIAQIFSADSGIECSTQAGREGVQELKEKFFNDISGHKETVTCELHTKFNKYNINREKQDRIYFFPGKQGIKDGRIIVKHIGAHL